MSASASGSDEARSMNASNLVMLAVCLLLLIYLGYALLRPEKF